MNNKEIIAILEKENYYLQVRELEDGSIVALGELLFTRAIYTDVSLTGFGNRFCFDKRELAESEFYKLKDMDSEPKGWIARR